MFVILILFILLYQTNSLPDFYKNSTEINERVKLLHYYYPDTTRLYSEEINGYEVLAIRIGYYLNKNTHIPLLDEQFKILIVCGQHARELISPELCMRLLEENLNEFVLPDKRLDIMFVPLIDPWGRDEVFKGRYCQRTNSNGVYLNRNWENCFYNIEDESENTYYYASSKKGGEEYPGRFMWDQPETHFLLKITSGGGIQGPPDLLINIHSGAQMVLYPYDGTEKIDVKHKDLHHIIALETREAADCVNECQIGPGSKILYRSIGTFMDSVSFSYYNTLAFTWEIFNGFALNRNEIEEDRFSDYSHCFTQFNPKSETTYNNVLKNWVNAYKRVIKIIFKIIDRKKNHKKSRND